MSPLKIVCSCKNFLSVISSPSCKSVFVQFSPLVEKYIRAVLSARAKLTSTNYLGSQSKMHERTKMHEGTKLHECTKMHEDKIARR